MVIDKFECKIPSLEWETMVRVFLPDGYEDGKKHYPVLYMNDGQYVFYDDDNPAGTSLKFAEYYQKFSAYVPEVILVAIDAASEPARRTRIYAPFTKEFQVSEGKVFESRIDGLGERYIEWVAGTLKPLIEQRYRCLCEARYNGYCGSSTGGLNGLYAAARYNHIFSRFIFMSPAAAIWMDCLRDCFLETDLSGIEKVYLDVGTNEFGRMTTKEEFLEGARDVQELLIKHGLPESHLWQRVIINGEHRMRDWSLRFPDALRWTFGSML